MDIIFKLFILFATIGFTMELSIGFLISALCGAIVFTPLAALVIGIMVFAIVVGIVVMLFG